MTTFSLLILLFLCVFMQGFFSMFEMAAVSFNKVRLEYYVVQKKRRALWLSSLLKNPSRLFGTTLILVNTLLQCGSEISRLFYKSIGMSPDFAPLTQIFIVLIFGELAPMFAARRHPEHVAFLHIPVVIFFSKVLTPIIWIINRLNDVLHRAFGKQEESSLFLSREELQKAFEENHESVFDEITERFFTIKYLRAQKVMAPLTSFPHVSSQKTVGEVRTLLQHHYVPFLLIYHQDVLNIVGIAYVRDLLALNDREKVVNYAKSSWFIIESDFILEILAQFRRNNQSVAIVLGESAKPAGLVTLDMLIDEIFGKAEPALQEQMKTRHIHFDKTVSGEMSLAEFHRLFHVKVPRSSSQSLSDYVIEVLGHHPEQGETLRIESLELEVLETSLFSVKKLLVKTLNV